MKKVFCLAIFFQIIFGSLSLLGAQTFISDNGYVEFVSTAPLNTFKGTSENLHGLIDLEKNRIDFYVDLNTLDTGIARRDRDMRNTYLESDKYPFAEFTGEFSQGLEYVLSADSMTEVSAIGTFTMRDIDQELVVDGTITSTEDSLFLEASWTILLKDFDIERPGILFYELAEEQTINIKIDLKKQI
ncbi:MAG: YceI family protein [Balneolaceae bacterium]|nr:YceI family protein [Balneolaceae bacterium]MDR9410416.1 YceI family protein [Balneolaceae bacterium]